MAHVTKNTWSPDEIEKLKAMIAAGASPLRVSVVLKRTVMAVKGQARRLGIPFARKARMPSLASYQNQSSQWKPRALSD